MPLVDFADAAGLRFIQVCSLRVIVCFYNYCVRVYATVCVCTRRPLWILPMPPACASSRCVNRNTLRVFVCVCACRCFKPETRVALWRGQSQELRMYQHTNTHRCCLSTTPVSTACGGTPTLTPPFRCMRCTPSTWHCARALSGARRCRPILQHR